MSLNDSDFTSDASDFPLTPESSSSVRGALESINRHCSENSNKIQLNAVISQGTTHLDQNKLNESELNFLNQSGLNDDFFNNLICCGLTITNYKNMVEHYEEYHTPTRDKDGNLINYTSQTMDEVLPQTRSYSQLLASTSIPIAEMPSLEFSLDDCNEQMMDNFRQTYGEHHLSLWNLAEQARNNPNIFYTALEQLQLKDKNVDSNDCIMSSTSPSEPPTQIGDDLEEYEMEYQAGCNEDGKVYKCPTEGCTKIYKNPNGLKYHINRGRCSTKSNQDSEKPYKCQVKGCFHSYKNSNGLKYHMQHSHQELIPNVSSNHMEDLSVNPSLLALHFRNMDPNLLNLIYQFQNVPEDNTINEKQL
ncbi:hypothetical protein K502DRAFT_322590 [Neoconidiobolus thromboides FSU 785]|nr:hypothetical protein K502DRAFT_322590 [Neoconidiobolus thromboides FSU 785]